MVVRNPAKSEFRKVSILIPVYNERYLVGKLIDCVLAAPLPENLSRELIIVDDASTDGTWEILQEKSAGNDLIKLFRMPRNRGKGAAIRKAINEASGDLTIFQDADLEYNPNEYARLLSPILQGYADAVYGSRFAAGGVHRVLYFRHTLANKFLTFLSNIFTDLNLTDIETGYKAFRTSLLKTIPLRSDRFGIEPEITAKIAKRGFRVYEVPISYYGRTYAEGKKITWKSGLEVLYIILKYALIDDLYLADDAAILQALANTPRFNKWLAKEISPFVGDNVLEVGAGLGNMTLKLLPREHYLCTEIDPIYLQTLKNLFYRRPYVDVQYLDIRIGFKEPKLHPKFDTVICLNVLEHIKEDQLSLCNMYNLLTPGGKLILLVPHSKFLYSSLDSALGHLKRYERDEIEGFIKEAGFELQEIRFFNRISTLGWIWNGKILKRRRFPRLQLKIYDSLVWLWKKIDSFLPWPAQSLIVIARRPLSSP